MATQSTNQIFLVRPPRFYCNPDTAADNAFQNNSSQIVTDDAHRELTALESLLIEQGIAVKVFDAPECSSPDSIFPNNWFSTHDGGTAVLYPMYNESRSRDLVPEIVEELKTRYKHCIDLRGYREQGHALEGTGSLVLDRVHRIAYASVSHRTSLALLPVWAKAMKYEIQEFEAFDRTGQPIYHTNVLMAVGTGWAIVCGESISDVAQRELIVTTLQSTGHAVLDISFSQLESFCGNSIELEGRAGERLILMSSAARDAFSEAQLRELSSHASIISASIPTIERFGGGGVRCMVAEVFD